MYYGWWLVLGLAVTETTSYGVLFYSFTVFVKPMQDDLGWSRGSLTGAFSLAALTGGLAGIPVGRWLDRHGPRALMTAGSIAATLLVLAWAATPNLFVFYLTWAGIGLVTAAVFYEPAFVVVATWFRTKRGRALTVLTFIAGFASVIYIPLAGALVGSLGWRQALVVLAVIVAAGTIPIHALLLRRRPADLGIAVDGIAAVGLEPEAVREQAAGERSVTARDALHGLPFWLLTAAFFLNGLGSSAAFVHFVPYLRDHGYSAGSAASIVGLIGVMALPGRLIFTPLGDRISRATVAGVIFSLQGAALAALLLVDGRAGVFAFVVLFGAGFGAVTPARAGMVADFYGPSQYGAISGALSACLTGSRALAPVAAGVAFDLAGSYTLVFWVLLGASAASVLTILAAERTAVRRGLIEPAAR